MNAAPNLLDSAKFRYDILADAASRGVPLRFDFEVRKWIEALNVSR